MLQAGIILFAGSSTAAAFANTGSQLIIWRAIMGVGGAMILPATLAIITNVFPREERGRAIGVWAGLNGIGIAMGPIIGGLIIENLDWNWIFLINIPIAVVALVAGWFILVATGGIVHSILDHQCQKKVADCQQAQEEKVNK